MTVADIVGNENHIGIHIAAFAVRYSLYHRLLFLLSHRQFQFVVDRANHCGKFADKLIHRHKVIVLVLENRVGDGGTIDNHFGGHFFCRGSGRFCRCCLRFGCCCLGLCGLGLAVRNRPVVRADTTCMQMGRIAAAVVMVVAQTTDVPVVPMSSGAVGSAGMGISHRRKQQGKDGQERKQAFCVFHVILLLLC